MRICIPEDYMKFELPREGEATHVSIGVDIKDIPKVRINEDLLLPSSSIFPS